MAEIGLPRKCHWDALKLMGLEQDRGSTVRVSTDFIEAKQLLEGDERFADGLYFRPVQKEQDKGGLRVISLKQDHPCQGMTYDGIKSNKYSYTYRTLESLQRALEKKLDFKNVILDKVRHEEKKLEAAMISYALKNGLKLPIKQDYHNNAPLYFIHDQWYFVGNNVVDLLAIDLAQKKFVVVELKEANAPDTYEKAFEKQAKTYCKFFNDAKDKFGPFFSSLGCVMATHYGTKEIQKEMEEFHRLLQTKEIEPCFVPIVAKPKENCFDNIENVQWCSTPW